MMIDPNGGWAENAGLGMADYSPLIGAASWALSEVVRDNLWYLEGKTRNIYEPIGLGYIVKFNWKVAILGYGAVSSLEGLDNPPSQFRIVRFSPKVKGNRHGVDAAFVFETDFDLKNENDKTKTDTHTTDFDLIQIVRTNKPMKGKERTSIDGEEDEENRVFYWADKHFHKITRKTKVGDTDIYETQISDFSGRDQRDLKKGSIVKWRAELSYVKKEKVKDGKVKYHEIMTIKWGYNLVVDKDGKVEIKPFKPIRKRMPSLFMLKTIREANKKPR